MSSGAKRGIFARKKSKRARNYVPAPDMGPAGFQIWRERIIPMMS